MIKSLGALLLLFVSVTVISFSISVGWRLGELAVPPTMPDHVILNVSPPLVPLNQ